MHPTVLEIDIKQFIENLTLIRSQIGTAKFCLPVKANAYGHGLCGISKIAEPYVDYLAVACLDEGEELRNAGIKLPILVFGAFDEEQISGLITNQLVITISSHYKAQLLVDYCRQNLITAQVQIKLDTGMNRVGVRQDSAGALIDYVLNSNVLELVGVYSHFASSEELDSATTYKQLADFMLIVNYVKKCNPQIICHIANSGSLCNYPESYLDMVRPGILSYGYFPSVDSQYSNSILGKIKPCLSLKSRVSYFKVVMENSGISYNHLYITNEQTRIVTVPIGYGDGYRRCLSNIAPVLIGGKRYKIAGAVCMDMFMVDIGASGEAYVGDEVVLIGRQLGEEILLQQIASLCNTISYEVLCGFNERIPRIYK